jgi:hypothetical protein
MILPLPVPGVNATHVQILRGVKDEEGNAITLDGAFGLMVTDGQEQVFRRNSKLAMYSRTISQWEVEDVFKPFAEARGCFPGDMRMSDALAFWNTYNLWDMDNPVPAPIT